MSAVNKPTTPISTALNYPNQATKPEIFAAAVREKVPNCIDNKFCNTMKIYNNTCRILKHIRDACPVSCKICASYKDNEKCKLIPDIKKVCKYDPEARKLCPRSCGDCYNVQEEIGIA